MADPFARIKVLRTEVTCYLRPGAGCDVDALSRDIDEACVGCASIEQLQARIRSVADRHSLEVEYQISAPTASDPIERLLSVGFAPRR